MAIISVLLTLLPLFSYCCCNTPRKGEKMFVRRTVIAAALVAVPIAFAASAQAAPSSYFGDESNPKRSVGPWRVRSRGMRIGVRTSPSDAGLAWSVRPSKRLALEPSPVRVFPVAPTSASTSLHVHIEGSGDGVRPHG